MPDPEVELRQIWDAVRGNRDSTAVAASLNGNVEELLKYVANNVSGGVIASVAAMLGLAPPSANDADVTISGATTWEDLAGYRRVGTLTINNGQTLTIARRSFVIVANEIVFGNTSSVIDGSGPDGADPSHAKRTQYNYGGRIGSGANIAEAGAAGIGLVVLANRVSGAAGVIRVNGGDGFVTGTSAATDSADGESSTGILDTEITTSSSSAGWPFHRAHQAKGGGTGGEGGFALGGGGGGGAGAGSAVPGESARTPLFAALALFALGLVGGGGGGAQQVSATYLSAGGGGGGWLLGLTGDLAVTPTIEADGGQGAANGTGTASDGGAGFAEFLEV